jgi:K+-sensing histidine kinase KdpD
MSSAKRALDLSRPLVRYTAALVTVATTTTVFIILRGQTNPTTVSLALVLVMLIAAIWLGRGPALVSAFAGALSLNFFFLPPYYTLTVDEPQNWVALLVFLAVAIAVGQLSAQARQRAEDAERLYDELQVVFDQASQTEAVKRSEKLKSALLDAVTHDIRTPLTSIKAATTMLIDEQKAIHRTLDPAGHADLLAVISEETDRLNSFVDSMVGLARVEAGGQQRPYEKVSVAELIANVIERASAVRARHEIEVKITPEDLFFDVDSRAMAEALYNVLDNAGKYSPAGTTIRMSAEPTNRGTRFTVEDEGPGIPVDEREKVFEKFYRREHISGGFGLGLAIVRGIVEGHGGKVWIEDGRKGARCILDIPMRSGE